LDENAIEMVVLSGFGWKNGLGTSEVNNNYVFFVLI